MLLLLGIALLAQLAGRLRVPYPVFLVCGGLAIAPVPGIPRVTMPPDIVFLVFLPPLLPRLPPAAALRGRVPVLAAGPLGAADPHLAAGDRARRPDRGGRRGRR